MQPNGVFSIDKGGTAKISTTTQFQNNGEVKYATQSGPMLVIEGNIHPKFRQNSRNMYIRNGVGILPNGNLLFAMSKQKINFYDFTSIFKNAGCRDALYLDGFVSRTYLPAKKWQQMDGSFSVIIGVAEKRAEKNIPKEDQN